MSSGIIRTERGGKTPQKGKKMFQVWKINDRGVYEKVSEVYNATLAAAIRKRLIRQGVFAQICKVGEMSIIGKARKE